MKFKAGDKVLIQGHWNYPDHCTGVISKPPEYVVELAEDQNPWDGVHRWVYGRKGTVECYWVTFDEPQFDSDGDGPYEEAEIEVEYITSYLKKVF